MPPYGKVGVWLDLPSKEILKKQFLNPPDKAKNLIASTYNTYDHFIKPSLCHTGSFVLNECDYIRL